MPAPTNTTIGTAYDLGSTMPVTYVQEQHFGGTTYDLWFKLTVPEDVIEIGPWAYGNFGSWMPVLSAWRTLASPVQIGVSGVSVPLQCAVTAGEDIYFKTITPAGNPNPALTTITVKAGPDEQPATGDIAINDSSDGYPAVIMNPSTAEPKAFRHPFAAGEGTAVLRTSGIVCAIDTDLGGVRVYNPDFLVRVTPTMPATGYDDCLGSNQLDTFWVGKAGGGATHAFIVAMDRDGTFDTPIDLGSSGLASVAPNAGGTVVYFTKNNSSTNQPVYAVTVPGAVISTFKAGVVGKSFGSNIFTLTDDTILVPYETSGAATIIRRYNAAGTEQTGSPYTFAVDLNVERIFAAIEDPTYFWIWTQASTTSSFTKVKISDGSTTTAGPWPKFISGVSQESAASNNKRFGADFSCVPWILRGVNPTTTYPIRRQRRFLLPSSPDNKRIQIPVLELLMRTGIGNSGAPNPQVMLRISKDGGKTWGPERWRSAGAIGRYADRVRWLRATGDYRNAVCEITVSDPVDWQWLAMLGSPEEGSS